MRDSRFHALWYNTNVHYTLLLFLQTNTALVIGIYNEPVPAGDCNVIVENLGDYLKESQY